MNRSSTADVPVMIHQEWDYLSFLCTASRTICLPVLILGTLFFIRYYSVQSKMMRKEASWLSVPTRPLSHLPKPKNKCAGLAFHVLTPSASFCVDHTAATRWHSLSRVKFELQNAKYFTSTYQPTKNASLHSTKRRETFSHIDSPQASLQYLRKGCFHIWLQQLQDQLRQK